MTIAIDIDEVLAELMPTFLEYYNKAYNTSFTNDHFYTYDWSKVLGITEEKKCKAHDDFIKLGGYKKLNVIDGSKAVIKKIKRKHKLVVITGRGMTLKGDTDYWLKRHFPHTFKDIFYIRKNPSSPALRSKAEICKQIKADVMIEDDMTYANSFLEQGTKLLLFNHPWNKEARENDNLVRVHSWERVQDVINNIL